MPWVQAVPLDKLREKPQVFKHPPRQIALFHVGDRVYAVDNRCPHEGYPLAEGHVGDDCLLTCNWHNWKFRLEDGECLLGGDHVRSYPARVEDGYAWVDLSDPPPEQTERQVLRGLRTAFEDRDFGRICREIARLHYHRLEPLRAVREALRWYHDRLEFGTTHAVPATADWLLLAGEYAGDLEPRLICLAEAVDHLAFDSLRHKQYAYAAAADEAWDAGAFVAAVEAEQPATAEGLAARALADGLHWPDMEEAFSEAALLHYNDFGHSLIYVAKTGQLLEHLGAEAEPHLLPPLARHLAYTTREDLLPEFKEYAPALELLPEPRWDPGGSGSEADRPEAPLWATTSEALAWLRDGVTSHPVERVYDALLEALAWNLLHFDTSYGAAFDRPVSQNVSWLDFTHGVTFANACRLQCAKFPRLWRPALVQMACFVGRNRGFLDREIDAAAWRVDDAGAFFRETRGTLLDHGLRDPIFSAHLLKTSVAVEDELPHVSPGCRAALLAGLNRFLHSPLKTKHVRRLARQAIQLVARDFA